MGEAVKRCQVLRLMRRMLGPGHHRSVRCIRRDGFCVVEGRNGKGPYVRGEVARAKTWVGAFNQARIGMIYQ